MDGAIVRRCWVGSSGWGGWPRAEVGIPSDTRPAFGGTEVRGITVHPQGHVAGLVANDGIRMCDAIVKQVHECLHGGLGAVGLLGGQGAKGNEHGRVQSMGVVEEDTNDFLETFVVGSIKHGGVVRFRGVLDFCAISGVLPGMGGMFWVQGMGMVKPEEGMFNIARHGDVDVVLVIVPVQC